MVCVGLFFRSREINFFYFSRIFFSSSPVCVSPLHSAIFLASGRSILPHPHHQATAPPSSPPFHLLFSWQSPSSPIITPSSPRLQLIGVHPSQQLSASCISVATINLTSVSLKLNNTLPPVTSVSLSTITTLHFFAESLPPFLGS